MKGMTNEQVTRMIDLCEQYAWMMKHKAPHLTHEELTSEFQMVCINIYNKYGFEEILFKRACHARLVDLVRYNYKYGTYAIDDESLAILLNDKEPSETTVADAASPIRSSVEYEYESNEILNNLKDYLYSVLSDDEKKLTYAKIRLFYEGAEYNSEYLEEFKDIAPTRNMDGQIAHFLGYTNGSSSGGYKGLRHSIRVFVAYFFHVMDAEEYLPEDWRNLPEDYYDSKKWLNPAREYFKSVKR